MPNSQQLGHPVNTSELRRTSAPSQSSQQRNIHSVLDQPRVKSVYDIHGRKSYMQLNQFTMLRKPLN